jgi:Bacterial low temperature requirement A protein (LtrA)
MLLIALGESVLAIGIGLGTGVDSIGLDRIAFAAISLLLAATMYWAYFGVGEDARAEAALDDLPAASCAWASVCSGSGWDCSGSPSVWTVRCRVWPEGWCSAR